MKNNHYPVIAGINITTDKEGRFSLNALHKASGEENSKRPSLWLAIKQSQELISELSKNSCLGQKVINVQKGGREPGVFADELLAVSYAGWISPAFQLQVNRAFIDSRKQGSTKYSKTSLDHLRDAKAIESRMNAVKEIFGMLPNLSEQSKQIVIAGFINPIAGNVIPVPVLEQKTFSATEIGERLGVSANRIGKIANKLQLKTAEFGSFFLDKSKYSDKQVETFRYNENAIEKIEQELRKTH